MRRLLSLICFGLPIAAVAGDVLGTKADPMPASTGSSGGVGFVPMLQMLFALALVLVLLKFLLPKLIGKFGKKMVTKLDGGIKIEESANFPGGTLYVVTARRKTLLVSVAASGVTCLSDLSEPDPLADAPTFQEMIDTSMAVVEVPDSTESQMALERLQRLAS